MDMQTQTQITLASELAKQGLSHTKIAAHLGRHRETIGLWLKGFILKTAVNVSSCCSF